MDSNNTNDEKIAEKAKEIFGSYDLNRNGTIEESELINLVADLSVVLRLPEPNAQEIRDLLVEFDTNNDGVLDLNEFIRFVRQIFYQWEVLLLTNCFLL